MIRTWKKGEKQKLGKFFSTVEFSCQCNKTTCVEQMISQELIDRLDKVREELGSPLTITSGYRCEEHQADLRKNIKGAAKTSQHTEGKAADVRAADMDKLLTLLEKHFKAIGIAKNFYHVDLRDDKIRRWNY